MREIKFRGKRVDNGEWVYGFYAVLPKFTLPVAAMGEDSYCEDGADYIIEFKTMQHPNFSNAYPLQVCDKEVYEVDPETVGQYTSLRDIKRTEEYPEGQEIYEGDITRFRHGGEFADTGIYFRNYEIQFTNTFTRYGLRFSNKSINFPCKCSTLMSGECEVIGNIHDNPWLLGR